MKYKFTEEDIKILENARKVNKNKNVERRLKAILLRAEGNSRSKVSEITGYNTVYISELVGKYRDHGIEAITENHYKGNHRNMTVEEEATIIEPFQKDAESGKIIEVSEIKKAYEKEVGHNIGSSQIYYVLHRHGWRKVKPRSKHPKKATNEAIEASKKLTNM